MRPVLAAGLWLLAPMAEKYRFYIGVLADGRANRLWLLHHGVKRNPLGGLGEGTKMVPWSSLGRKPLGMTTNI
jgi:hypothetical protein